MPTKKNGKLPTTASEALAAGKQPLLKDMFNSNVNYLQARQNRDRYQTANFFGGLPNEKLSALKKNPELYQDFYEFSKRKGAKNRAVDPNYMLRYNPEVDKPFSVPVEFSAPNAINKTSVSAPQVEPELQLFRNGGQIGNGFLPEYGFGSWLKGNLGTIGGLVSAIPVVGNIAGPVISGIGSFLNAQDSAKEEQGLLDEQSAAQAEEQRVANLNTRRSNIVDDKQVNYGATFEDGGTLGMGFVGEQPQITEYTNGTSHEEGVGGIPVDSRGNPATTSKSSAVGLTEKGEVTWNGYVFSDKLKNE